MKHTELTLSMPGEILLHEFMKPFKLTQYKLAKALDVPPIRISQIIRGKRAITPDTALRLSRYFGNSAEFWINLQAGYDLKIARIKTEKYITEHIRPFHAA